MTEFKEYIKKIIKLNNLDCSGKRASIIDEFVADNENVIVHSQILDAQNSLIFKFMSKLKLYDIINQHLQIPNAAVNKFYEYKIDIPALGKNEIVLTKIDDLQQFGLQYNNETEILSGTPIISGDFKINLQFRIKGEDDEAPLNIKPISLIINADPKSLWKNIPSDDGRDDEWKLKNYWKNDVVKDFQALGDKHIVVASTRGRSHANVGSFREDDYAFAQYKNTGWSIVCVADGAGSAKLSRLGSKIASEGIIDYFRNNFNEETSAEFDILIKDHRENAVEETQKKLNVFIYNNLQKATFAIHKKLDETANKLEVQLKDFHSTLIFALFKKFEFGYAVLTFGVGDCPIGLINKDQSEIKLMNWLDVGEFGGGTRFITMPEIFSSDKFQTRLGFKIIDDFSYLILMTDGIYDPKFIVEASLEKLEKWKEFLADLDGNNDEKIKVDFKKGNKEIANQLSAWMNFWSPGNHDDRTLAIVF